MSKHLVYSIVVILSAWAVIKVPMLANEAKFLSLHFMGIRWILTVTSIIIMSRIVSMLVKRADIPLEKPMDTNKGILVNHNYCVGCGLCAKDLPNHFKMVDKKAVVIDRNASSRILLEMEKVAKNCPTGAIKY